MPKERAFEAFEEWELEMARGIAKRFRTDVDELHAELLKRILELKLRKNLGARNWRSFLARSLYNAARDFIRRQQVRDRYFLSLNAEKPDGEDRPSTLEDILEAPEQSIDFPIDVRLVLEELSPELRALWTLLLEENGNVNSVARRLGKPHKTVEYWVQKIKALLRRRGLD